MPTTTSFRDKSKNYGERFLGSVSVVFGGYRGMLDGESNRAASNKHKS